MRPPRPRGTLGRLAAAVRAALAPTCPATDRGGARCVLAADGHELHEDEHGRRWTGSGAHAIALPREARCRP